MVKKRYTVIPAKKRAAPLVEHIDSFNQVRRGPSVINVGMPMSDQQARDLRSVGFNTYCMTTGSGTYAYATEEEANDAAEAYCDRVEASYRARGIMYFDKKFNKMSYELTKEELASYDQKTPSTKDSKRDKVSGRVEQKTSSMKDKAKTTVAAEQETNPGIPKESKKAPGASSEINVQNFDQELKKAIVALSEVDTPISKDLSSFAAGDYPEVVDVNKEDQVDSVKGEFHISFESKDSPDVSVKVEEVKPKSTREGEAEMRAAINKGMRRGFLLPKESKKVPDSDNADSLVLNDCIPSFEAGDCPNVTNTTSTIDSLLPKKLHLSSSGVNDHPEVTETRDDPEEEEWHDEDTHGSFNPADPKCKCAIS